MPITQPREGVGDLLTWAYGFISKGHNLAGKNPINTDKIATADARNEPHGNIPIHESYVYQVNTSKVQSEIGLRSPFGSGERKSVEAMRQEKKKKKIRKQPKQILFTPMAW